METVWVVTNTYLEMEAMNKNRLLNSKLKSELNGMIARWLQPLNFKLSRHATRYITSEINSLKSAYLWLSRNETFIGNQFKEVPIIFLSSDPINSNMQSILNLALRAEGSDKTTLHSYDEIYSHILQTLSTKPTILEIGVGSSISSSIGFMGKGYRAGASLRAWKSLLPNARIIGADIDESTLIPQEGIELKYVDQTSGDSLAELSDFLGSHSCDLIIDDGLHSPLAALNTFNALWPCLKSGGFYVIEDMSAPLAAFYRDMSLIFEDVSHSFYDMSAARSRITNCLSVYRKL